MRVSFARYRYAVLFLLFFGLNCTAAQAQKSALAEKEPWLVQNVGPEKAKGIIYLTRGFTFFKPITDEYRGAHSFLVTLNKQGWDVIGAKYPYQPSYSFRPAEVIPTIAPYLSRRAKELRQQGYKRIVFAGQSWGAWTTLVAANRHGLKADAIILVAPATYGQRISPVNGKPNPNFERNRSEYRPLISKTIIPTVAIFFAGDDFDPGGRGAFTKKVLEKQGALHLILNEPVGFKGHGSGWLPIFDFAFANCVDSFISHPKNMSCEHLPLDDTDFRAIATKSQTVDVDSKLIRSSKELVGRQFAVYTISGEANRYKFNSERQVNILSTDGEQTKNLTIKAGRLCIGNDCADILKWNDHQFIRFDPKTAATTAWWVEIKN